MLTQLQPRVSFITDCLQETVDLSDRDLLITGTELVLAHYHGLKVVEVFQLRRTENELAGWAKKVSYVLPTSLSFKSLVLHC